MEFTESAPQYRAPAIDVEASSSEHESSDEGQSQVPLAKA